MKMKRKRKKKVEEKKNEDENDDENKNMLLEYIEDVYDKLFTKNTVMVKILVVL